MYRSLLTILYFLSVVLAYPQSNILSKKIPILKTYSKKQLLNISLPIGGIGTGTVGMGGRGELRDWEIMNVPAKGYSTVTKGNDAPFFAIYTKSLSGAAKTKALLGPLNDSEYDSHEGRSVNHHGLPRFKHAQFETSYPFGIVRLSDKTMPVQINMVGFNPFIPGDSDNSGIPIAILKYEVTNTSSEDIEVSIAGSMRNFIGKDGVENRIDWKGDEVPLGAKNNRNKYIKMEKKGFQGIYMYSDGVEKTHKAWGTMALVTPEKQGIVSYRTSGSSNEWAGTMLDFWDDFIDDGLLQEKLDFVDDDPMASLAVKKKIAVGETKTFTFFLTWHFPNRFAWSKSVVGNYYTTRYKNAWNVLEKEVSKIPMLTKQTCKFVKAFVDSDYDKNVKEAALFNLSTLRSQTVFRNPDGIMFGWEGIMNRYGSCLGSCTHVWNYEQATAFLFGDLARSMRKVEFGYATRKSGHMGFRVFLPLNKDPENASISLAAADGQMGTIMKFYRDWQLSGKNDFLKKYWNKVKLALSFAWIKGGWDGNQDGVMEGVQHNTMDVEYFGPNPQMQIWYLGALRAGQEMAKAMKDRKFAKKCENLFKKGSVWTDKNLFNGEYYEHKIQTPKSRKEVAQGLMVSAASRNIQNPDYQLSSGCLVDQLVGQYMSHVVGLGYLLNPKNVKKTLESILKYNQTQDMYNHFNNMRSYVMGDEKALLMATWPQGGRPKIPFPYWSEVMTGFEYTAAVGMLYEGMDKQGLEVIKNIRDRYQGNRRNPFDEVECGRHYARAMASWAGILAQSGFHYSGVKKHISFTEKPGTYFWSNGSAWGTCKIVDKLSKKQVTFSVLKGVISFKNFSLANKKQKTFAKNHQVKQGEEIIFDL